MNVAREARKLADFITDLEDSFQTYQTGSKFCYYHIGALFTDVVLQAGVSYNAVVRPRVQKVLIDYPDALTLGKFLNVVNEQGLENIINWSHHIKLGRFLSLVEFSLTNNIDSCHDFKRFLSKSHNHLQLLEINGFGPKTLDYLLRLLNFDIVAVDRHVYAFVELADVNIKGYQEIKKVVEYAADFLNIPRASIDYSIWKYMSEKKFKLPKANFQCELEFSC